MKRKRNLCSFVISLALLLALQMPVKADLITLDLTGTILSIHAKTLDGEDDTAAFDAVLPFSVGTPFTASVTYDLSVPDTNEDPEFGRYFFENPGDYFVWDINGTVLFGASDIHTAVTNTAPDYPGDTLVIRTSALLPADWAFLDPTTLYLLMGSRGNDIFPTDALPTSLDYDDVRHTSHLALHFEDYNSEPLETPLGTYLGTERYFTGKIETLTLERTVSLPEPIPEPATVLLLGTGLVGLAIPRIRKKLKR